MKVKIPFIIFTIIISTYIVLEYKNIWNNWSLVLANIYQDISYYRGSELWITRYNEAIWLTKKQQYIQAKALISPLLNDTTQSKKSEIAELYGDLIYATSGSLDDSIRMYERSLSFTPNERISKKIEYLKKISPVKTLTWSTKDSLVSSGTTNPWSLEKIQKKEELQKIGKQRAEFLSNYTSSSDTSRKNIEKLLESANSDSIYIIQDW